MRRIAVMSLKAQTYMCSAFTSADIILKQVRDAKVSHTIRCDLDVNQAPTIQLSMNVQSNTNTYVHT